MNTIPSRNSSKVLLSRSPGGALLNYVDPPSLEGTVLAIGVTLIVLSGIILIMRLATNYKHHGSLAIDDYLCLFGELGGIAYWALAYSSAREGNARHTWDIPHTAVTKSFLQRQFAQRTVIAPTMWAVKTTILSLYIRIFGSVRRLRLTSYALMHSMLLFYGSMVVVAIVFCIPRDGAPWDEVVQRRCSIPVPVNIVIGTFTVAIDLVLFTLPFPVIFKLHLTRRKKIGLSVVFLLGLLTVITSIVCLGYRVIVFKGFKYDPAWNAMNVVITTFAEIFGTIIISCAPALSLWLTIFTKTTFYQSFRSAPSRTSASWTGASRTTLRPSDDGIYLGDRHGRYDSTAKLKHYQVIDLESTSHAFGKPPAISSASVASVPSSAAISKSTEIEQGSERI